MGLIYVAHHSSHAWGPPEQSEGGHGWRGVLHISNPERRRSRWDLQALIMIPESYSICGINHCIVRPSLENRKDLALTLLGRWSNFRGSQRPLAASSPTCLLQDCSANLFGSGHFITLLFFLVCHGEDSPVTNHPRFPIQVANSALLPVLFTALCSLLTLLLSHLGCTLACHVSLFQSVTCTSCFIDVCVFLKQWYVPCIAPFVSEKKGNRRHLKFGYWTLIGPAYK